MRKILIISALIALLQPHSSFAADSDLQGKPCTKVGASNYVGKTAYVCIMSGSKMIWRKVTISTSANRSVSVLDNGLKLLQSQIDPNYDKTSININIEPGIEKYLWVKDSIDSIKSAKQLLSAFKALPTDPIDTYVVWNINYMKPYLNSGCFSWAPNGGGGSCGPRIMWANLGWFGKNIQVNNPSEMTTYLSDSKKQWILANLQHELGHVGQQTLAIQNHAQKDTTPAWLREGEAEVFKVLSYANQFNLSYSQSRGIYFAENSYRCASTSLKDLSEPKSYPSSCEYDNGLLATEYLIQRLGNIRALFWWDSKGVGTSVKEQFKTAFGLDLDQFLISADAYIKRQK